MINPVAPAIKYEKVLFETSLFLLAYFLKLGILRVDGWADSLGVKGLVKEALVRDCWCCCVLKAETVARAAALGAEEREMALVRVEGVMAGMMSDI